MIIRPATPEDEAEVTGLLCRCYPVLMASFYDERTLVVALPLMTRANPALLGSGTFHIVEDAGTVVGCGGWTFERPGSGDIEAGLAHLRHFAVDPATTGHGIGATIFRECRREAEQRGATRLQAFSSLNAEAFYRRMGLQRIEAVELPMGGDVSFPAILMEGSVRIPK